MKDLGKVGIQAKIDLASTSVDGVEKIQPVVIPTNADTDGLFRDVNGVLLPNKIIPTKANMQGAKKDIGDMDAPTIVVPVDPNTNGAKEKLSGWAKLMGSDMGGILNVTLGTLISQGVTKILSTAGKQLMLGLNAGGEIGVNAQQAGMSTGGYQQWAYVLEKNGASVKALETGMRKLNDETDKALRQTGSAAEKSQANFKKLNISMQTLGNSDREQAFEMVITGLQGITDESERAALANDLLGESAQEMAKVLNLSPELLAAQKMEAVDSGFVLDEKQIKAATDYKEAMDGLTKSWEGLRNDLGTSLGGALTVVVDGLAKIVTGAHDGVTAIQELFTPPEDKISADVKSYKDQLDTFKADIEKIKEDYAKKEFVINVVYSESLGLLDAYENETDPEKKKDYAAQLTERYASLSGYIGENGLFSKEASAIRDVISAMADLDRQMAMSQMIQGIDQQIANTELQQSTLKQLAYNKAVMAKDALQSYEDVKSKRDIAGSDFSTLQLDTPIARVDRVAAAEQAIELVTWFSEAYTSEFKAMELPGGGEFINKTIDEIVDNADYRKGLAATVDMISAALSQLETKTKEVSEQTQRDSDAATKAYQDNAKSTKDSVDFNNAAMEAYLLEFGNMTQEQIDNQKALGESVKDMYNAAKTANEEAAKINAAQDQAKTGAETTEGETPVTDAVKKDFKEAGEATEKGVQDLKRKTSGISGVKPIAIVATAGASDVSGGGGSNGGIMGQVYATNALNTAKQEATEKTNELAEAEGNLTTETQEGATTALDEAKALEAKATAQEKLAKLQKSYADAQKDAQDAAKKAADSIAGAFDRIKGPRKTSVKKMTQGSASQEKYWTQYNDALTKAQERGVSKDILAGLTDGSAESLGKLQALVNSTDAQFQKLTAVYESAEAAKKQFAETSSEINLENDESFQAISKMLEPETIQEKVAASIQAAIESVQTNTEPLRLALTTMFQKIFGTGGETGAGTGGTPTTGETGADGPITAYFKGDLEAASAAFDTYAILIQQKANELVETVTATLSGNGGEPNGEGGVPAADATGVTGAEGEEAAGPMAALGAQLMTDLAAGVSANQEAPKTAVGAAINNALMSAGPEVSKFRGLGGQISAGIATGVSGNAGLISSAVVRAIAAALQSGKNAADSHSPSRLFERELGAYIPAGAAVGVDKNAYLMEESVERMIENSLPGVGGVSQRVAANTLSLGRSASVASQPKVIVVEKTVEQVNHFNQPVQTPDEFANTMRLYATYGDNYGLSGEG